MFYAGLHGGKVVVVRNRWSWKIKIMILDRTTLTLGWCFPPSPCAFSSEHGEDTARATGQRKDKGGDEDTCFDQ